MVIRVSTASLHNQNLKDINLVQVDLAKLNRQISSGNKAETFQDLNGAVERVSGYQTKLDSFASYKVTNTTVTSRLDAMDASLTSISDIASKFSSLLTGSSVGASSETFLQQSQSYLNQISSILNTSQNGTYVFGGSKTNSPPVATPVPDLAIPGVPENTYYQGDYNTSDVRVSDTQTINYGVTAGDPAFQNLVASIKTAMAAYKNSETPNPDLIKKAIDLKNSAVSGITALHSKVGANQNVVNDANSLAETASTYITQSISDDTSTDIAEASIQLSVDQTVLQATFQAFAKISKLKLTDYL